LSIVPLIDYFHPFAYDYLRGAPRSFVGKSLS
jgi:hypothetical protein